MAGDTHFRPWFNIDGAYPEIGYGAAKATDGSWRFVALAAKTDTVPTPLARTALPITGSTGTTTQSGQILTLESTTPTPTPQDADMTVRTAIPVGPEPGTSPAPTSAAPPAATSPAVTLCPGDLYGGYLYDHDLRPAEPGRDGGRRQRAVFGPGTAGDLGVALQ